MSEVIPIRPVVEVREAFKPSAELRNALVDFLDPGLDQDTILSLRAALLFKTWRQRIMTQETYHQEERTRKGSVHIANERFEALSKTPMLLDGKIGVAFNRRVGRIVVRPIANSLLVATNTILDSIPTIQPDPTNLDAYVSLYVDIPREHFASEGIIREARNTLHEKSIHPSVRGRYYVTPDRLTIRETMAAIRPPNDDTIIG